jgi:excisionase family DNA binding protein
VTAQFLTLAEAAAVVRLSPRTLRRGMHDSRRPLRVARVGRRVIVERADLLAWLRAHVEVPAVSAPVLGRVSPAARELLEGLADVHRSPGGGKGLSRKGGLSDSVSASRVGAARTETAPEPRHG